MTTLTISFALILLNNLSFVQIIKGKDIKNALRLGLKSRSK